MFLQKPKGIDEVNPINELREEIGRNPKKVGILIFVDFMIADFMSGLLTQMFQRIWNPRIKIGIVNCFIQGIVPMIPLTVILFAVFVYFSFRVYRKTKKTYEKNYDDNYLRSKKETYGGAHFQTEEELTKNGFKLYDSIKEAEGDIFGITENNKIAVFTYPAGLNRNEIYFGAPGSGKSASIVKTKLYQNILAGNSIVLTDSKGALYDETSNVARKYGYDVKAVMLKPAWFKNSDGFDMFENIKANDEELDSKADVIANTIIKNTSSSKGAEDYWGTNEFNLIKCVVMHVATDPQYIRQGKNHLPEVFNFLTKNDSKTMAGIFRNYQKDSPIRQCYEIFAKAEEKNQGQIINGASVRLAKLTNKYLQQALSNSEMKMTLPMKKKCVYYVIISSTDDSYKFASSMLFSTMINAMCEYSDSLSKEAKKKQLPVQFLCDEHKNTGGIEGLPLKIADVRSRKIGLTLIMQDKGQLDSLYGEIDATTILNCCTVKGLLSTNDLVTAKYMSDLLGKQTVLVENLKLNEAATDVVHAHDVIEKTLGEGTRPLMQPEELMNNKLGRDNIIYVISGMPPVKLKKCFAEKQGEAIHPLEKEAVALGERKCNRHKPKWRRLLEEQQKQEEEAAGAYAMDRPEKPMVATSVAGRKQIEKSIPFDIPSKPDESDFDPGFEEENSYEPELDTI